MEFISFAIPFAALVFLTVIVGGLMNYYMDQRGLAFNPYLTYLLLPAIVGALYFVGGFSMWTVKGIVLALILLRASVQDLSERKADEFLWVMLLILALVNYKEVGITSMIFGALGVFLPQFIVVMFFKTKGQGGADFKFSTAAALCLGFYGGVIGYMIGLVFAIVFQTIYNKVKKQSNKEAFVVAGRTSSGKTTLLNSLLGSIPDSKRIYTIESGARELSLVKRDEQGRVINNVVHTLSRPSDKDIYDITQEDLVMAALRFDPDVICVGEMRDAEAHSAVEASSTDHTVVTTVHGGGGRYAHRRIAFLSQRRFPIDMKISMQQAALAFPVVVFAHKLEDNTRKVMDISECIVHDDGELEYRTLYRYKIHSNEYVDGQFHIVGEFIQENSPSEYLRSKLLRGGIPHELLKRFEREEGSV